MMSSRSEVRLGSYTISRHPALGSSGTFSTTNNVDNFAVFTSEVNTKAGMKAKLPTNHKFTKSYLQYYRGSDVYVGSGPNEGYYSNRSGLSGDLPFKALTVEPPSWVRDQAISRLYDKMRGQIDLSIDVYQASQTVKFVKKVANLVSFVRNFPGAVLEKSYKAYLAELKHYNYRGNARRAIERSVGSKYKVPWLRKDAVYDLHTGEVRSSVPGFPKGKANFRSWKEPSDWRGAFKGPGSLWLEYRYGAGQTAQTLYDTVIELSRSYEPLMRVDGKAKELDNGSGRNEYISPWCIENCSWNQSHRVWIRMQYKHSAETLQLLSKFTTLNPISFVYENIPFSFVADWAWNVGGYLRSIESAILAQSVFVGGWEVKTTYAMASGSIAGSYADSANTRSVSYGGGYKVYKFKARSVLASPPVPSIPRFKVELSSGRMLNAAALLTNLLRK